MTPRQGITPRSYYQTSTTPRTFNRAAGLPSTPSSVLSGFGADGFFKTDDLPPDEFNDCLNQLDSFVNPKDGSFKSLSDALSENFNINEVSTLNQRLKSVPLQPYRVKDMHPVPLFLLTKRQKKCKTCSKILVKPSKDMKSANIDSVTFLLRDSAPKVTIYRFGKYQEGQPVEVQLKFDNMSESTSQSKVQLLWLEEEDNTSCNPVALPNSAFTLESSDILTQPPSS